jgi:hypothetical protein
MARDWGTWLANAARGPSEAEKEARDRTEARIRAAIEASPALAGRTRVFVKGSYATNTNVRSDADVDIGVRWTEWSYVEHAFRAKGLSAAQIGYTPVSSGPDPATYRQWVRDALVSAFGTGIVKEGNKAILVKASSSTLDADVVPCFGHSRYDAPGEAPKSGIRVYPRDGSDYIINWPQQNLENGRAKNGLTSKRFKRIVRATKRLENDMVANRLLEKEVPSYLIECLLWNVRDGVYLSSDSLLAILRNCFVELWGPLRDRECSEWGEVNELKYLFRPGQVWNELEAYTFIDKAWDYVGIG